MADSGWKHVPPLTDTHLPLIPPPPPSLPSASHPPSSGRWPAESPAQSAPRLPRWPRHPKCLTPHASLCPSPSTGRWPAESPAQTGPGGPVTPVTPAFPVSPAFPVAPVIPPFSAPHLPAVDGLQDLQHKAPQAARLGFGGAGEQRVEALTDKGVHHLKRAELRGGRRVHL
ncbi:unnamed protein product [Closterium sp. NIES-54]